MNQYFLTKIKYLKQSADDGTIKSSTEEYVLNSLSFIEAETRLQTILEEYIAEYELIKCDKMNIQSVIIDESKSNFFKVKVSFVSEDAEAEKGKPVNEVYLVQANETKEAFEKIETRFEDSVVNWEVLSVSKTKISDFFPYVEERIIESEVIDFDSEEIKQELKNPDSDLSRLLYSDPEEFNE